MQNVFVQLIGMPLDISPGNYAVQIAVMDPRVAGIQMVTLSLTSTQLSGDASTLPAALRSGVKALVSQIIPDVGSVISLSDLTVF